MLHLSILPLIAQYGVFIVALLIMVGELGVPTGVPAELVATSVHPVFSADGFIAFEGLTKLQSFFRDRDQIEYDTDLDPYSLADETFVMSAMAELNPNSP